MASESEKVEMLMDEIESLREALETIAGDSDGDYNSQEVAQEALNTHCVSMSNTNFVWDD